MLRLTFLPQLGLACLFCLPLVATPIVGGIPGIFLTGAFTRLVPTVTPPGNASLSAATIRFPITGGDIGETTLLGIYEHEVSDLAISNPVGTLDIKNLAVNPITGRVFAMLWLNGGRERAPSVFVLQNDQSVALAIPEIVSASAAIGLDASALSGIVAGSAFMEVSSPATGALPEPSTLLIMFAGTAMLWAGRQRLAR